LKYTAIKCRLRGPVARQPALLWQPVCAPLVGGRPRQPTTMKLIGTPSKELWWILAVYILCPCDLDLWPLDLGVTSRDATWVFNTCAKFEMYSTYRSRVITITIFHWPPAKSPNFHVFGGKGGQISNFIFLTPKVTSLAGTTYNDVLRVGMCPKMRPVGVMKKGKKRTNFHASNWLFAQTTHVDVPPEILHAGSYPGSSYIFQFSWKSVEGSRSCWGSKIALSHWLGPWLIQQLVLPYKPWYYRGCRYYIYECKC